MKKRLGTTATITRNLPHPSSWPAWVHYLAMIAIFAAGMLTGIVWLSSAWVIVVLVAIVSITSAALWLGSK